MDQLPLHVLIIICDYYSCNGDLRTLALVNRSLYVASRIRMDQVTADERRLFAFIDKWQAKFPGKLAVVGWPCVVRKFGFPYKIFCSDITVYHLGGGTEDIPHPTQDGVLMPTYAGPGDNDGWKLCPVVPGVRLARREIPFSGLDEFLGRMPMTVTCQGYTDSTHITIAPFRHADTFSGDPKTCYFHPDFVPDHAERGLSMYGPSILAARLLGYSVKIPAFGSNAAELLLPLTYISDISKV